jgi:hypothetical protein
MPLTIKAMIVRATSTGSINRRGRRAVTGKDFAAMQGGRFGAPSIDAVAGKSSTRRARGATVRAPYHTATGLERGGLARFGKLLA